MKVTQYINYVSVKVPVYRDGKPTKRMKTEIVDIYGEFDLIPVEVCGHTAYIADRQVPQYTTLYREDGTPLIGSFTFGRYGKALHDRVLEYDVINKKMWYSRFGYDGPCGKGMMARLVKINW